jgi:hypothetical protein
MEDWEWDQMVSERLLQLEIAFNYSGAIRVHIHETGEDEQPKLS